jgi:carbamoyl-phosphate synthase large subunit
MINFATEKFSQSSNNTKKVVLFTGGGGAGCEALFRLLDNRYEIHFADADLEAIPCHLPENRRHKIPYASNPIFIEKLYALCRKLAVDVLIPCVDEELLPIAQSRESVTFEILLPPADFVRAHLDKLTSNSLLLIEGLPAPYTLLLSEPQRCMPFPCIAKPRCGRGSNHVAVVYSEQELQAHVLLSRRSPDDFIVQERLIGQEYTVMMSADRNGNLIAIVPVLVGIKKGITLRARTDHDERVISACFAIHSANPVSGCYNIQLIKTELGEVKPFEINPRISTTACLAVAAGVDFISAYLNGNQDCEADNSSANLLKFRDRVVLRRSWHNEFIE